MFNSGAFHTTLQIKRKKSRRRTRLVPMIQGKYRFIWKNPLDRGILNKVCSKKNNQQFIPINDIMHKTDPMDDAEGEIDEELLFQYFKELVGQDNGGKNWKGIGIALIAIIFICSLIAIAMIFAQREINDGKDNRMRLSLSASKGVADDLKTFNASWSSDHTLIYLYKNGTLSQYNILNKEISIVIRKPTGNFDHNYEHFASSNNKYLIISRNIETIYRQSRKAVYEIIDLKEKKQFPIPIKNNGKEQKCLYAKFSPKSKFMIVVHEYDIYMHQLPITKSSLPKRITENGKFNEIHNGVSDWLYEEEIMHKSDAIYWSPNDVYCAFIQFDDRNVSKYQYKKYDHKSPNAYNIMQMSYPKPGEKNPITKIFLISNKMKLKELILNIDVNEYFYSLTWKNDNEFIIQHITRLQTTIIYRLYNIATKKLTTLLRFRCPINSWLTPNKIIVDVRKNQIYALLPDKSFHNDKYYYQIAKFSALTPSSNPTFVTFKNYNVEELIELVSNEIYFTTTSGDPRNRYIFALNVQSKNLRNISNLYNSTTNCSYYSPMKFSTTKKFYEVTCLGPDVPYSEIRRTADHELLTVWEDNMETRKKLTEYRQCEKRQYQITLSSGERTWVQLLVPTNLRESETYIYPVLVWVYGAPGTQEVSSKWDYQEYVQYICSKFDTIIASMDGRGTAHRSLDFQAKIYQSVGNVEVADQHQFVNYLYNLSYVDKSKIGMWGWSYGAYVTLLSLMQKESHLNCAVFVAPVTDWLLYDSAYVERYLRYPNETNNYLLSSILNKDLSTLNNTKLMLMYGTGDDNVHPENSLLLINKFVENSIDFNSNIYPNRQHSINGIARIHLYNKLTKFFGEDCFNNGRSELPMKNSDDE
ncbi:hypothetical protein SNEBB_010086 [Seison nebaliae]|nr:hypothetical protein SNEBB_010086 [Seison nebaliae]